jgi:hypothetical protein
MKQSFGVWNKLKAALGVFAVVALSILVWGLVNVVFTKPELRGLIDLTRGARFTLSDTTKELVKEVREGPHVLEIHTFILQFPKGDPRARIQSQVVELTRDLLERLRYLGGQKIQVIHHDLYREIQSTRQARDELGIKRFNTLVLKLGARKRILGILTDLADIEFPAEKPLPGQALVPVLRSYPGEAAVSSALGGLLHDRNLLACWLTGHEEGLPTDGSGVGYADFARQLAQNGFENRILDLDKEAQIPPECRLLLILQPKRVLFERHVSKILQYLRGGGRVLMTEGYWLGTEIQTYASLLGPLGLHLRSSLLCNGVLDPSGGLPAYGTEECLSLQVSSGISGTHPATKELRQRGESFVFRWGREIEILDAKAGAEAKERRVSRLLSTHPFAFEEVVPKGRAPDFRPASEADLGVKTLGVSVVLGEEGPKGDREKEGRFILLSGLAFQNGEQLLERNLNLALSLVRWLSHQRTLVRTGTLSLAKEHMEVSPQARERAKWVLYLVPAFFLFFALFVLLWRRRS